MIAWDADFVGVRREDRLLVDGHAVSHGSELEADVCIVGAGPAGITLARELRGTGTKVLLLEGGDQAPVRAARTQAAGESVGAPYFRLHDTRVRAFGGTSNHWFTIDGGLRARPLDEIDFETRPGVPHSGWPVGRAELLPYYERAQQICRLGPFDYTLDTWESPAAPRLPLDGSSLTSVIFQIGPTQTFIEQFDELARAPDVTLMLHATVLEVVTDSAMRQVTRLRVGIAPGREFTVSARLYVLASGGIENARLLLLSTGSQRAGVGNGHDLVGRFFMEHLGITSGVLVNTPAGLFEQTALYRLHAADGVRIHAKLSLEPEVVRRESLLNCTFYLLAPPPERLSAAVESFSTLRRARNRQPRPPHLLAHTANVVTHPGGVARMIARRLARSGETRHAFQLSAMAEQAPNRDSRVTLGTRRDTFGLPVARLNWQLSDVDTESARRTLDIIGRELRRAGLGELERKLGDERPPLLIEGLFHHLGTTRMSEDPARGVVDSNGRVHDVENLFVTGGSVFPTGGYANPTLTIIALATRLADHLKARLLDRQAPLP